jgi:hypothetical protein
MNELLTIQTKLVANKDLLNKFGGYSYRSTETILASLKPLLEETKCTIKLSDELVQVGDRIYVKATATLKNSAGDVETADAYAREDDVLKGMASSQITGSTSSYARKYALNGLLAIDDTKDADATNTHGKDESPSTKTPGKTIKAPDKAESPVKKNISNTKSNGEPLKKETLIKDSKQYLSVVAKVTNGTPIETVKNFFTLTEEVEKALRQIKPVN